MSSRTGAVTGAAVKKDTKLRTPAATAATTTTAAAAAPGKPSNTNTKKSSAVAKVSDDFNETDAVIEELKSLAKSMLEATNAARRRTNEIETRRSYEALMGAIDNRTSAPGDVSSQRAIQQEARHRDPTIPPKPSTDTVTDEALTDIPASLSPQLQKLTASWEREGSHPFEVSAGTLAEGSAAAGGDDHTVLDTSKDVGDNASSIPADEANRSNATGERDRRYPRANESREADEDEHGVYDGVKTTILFASTDPVLYNEVASSTWKPEALLLYPDGTTAQPKETEDDHEADEEAEEAAAAEAGTRHRVAKPKPRKVYRVPSFPYGGGVTEAQSMELSKRFQKSIRSRTGSSTRPLHITAADFHAYRYPEVPATEEERRRFNPKSPYDFVVEVDEEVLFDAVRAREARRREFEQMVREKRAPATMGSFNLRVIMDPIKTGFEDEKTFPIVRGAIVADRYQIIQLLGKATFSRAVRCYDLHQPIYADEEDDEAGEEEAEEEDGEELVATAGGDGQVRSRSRKHKGQEPIGYTEVCLKIINNSKDFFDQSLDEIRLLTLINAHKDPDEAHVIRLIDAFYYKEHTMLVTELLADNLYEYSKYNREEEEDFYFTLPRLRRIARQVTEALAYVHSLNLIHADLKPENILFLSHRRCIVKVIDFGSSCFLSDHLSSYIQSRSYRAPEVVLGCDYDGRIDVWSLGGILVELVTGDVLFPSQTVPDMLARILYVLGQTFPRQMLWEGRHTNSFINKFGCIYENGSSAGQGGREPVEEDAEEPYYIYTPVPPVRPAGEVPAAAAAEAATAGAFVPPKPYEPYGVLFKMLSDAGVSDPDFFSFVKACFTLDHKKRPTSQQLLSHPFIANEKL